VVLLDREIPGSSGGELLTAFREQPGRCRVAMVTGVEPDFDIIDMGFDDYLTKPVTSEGLTEAVARLLRRDEVAAMTRRLFSLARKRSVLQASKPADELTESDEFARLEREIARLRSEIDASLERIDSGEMVSLVREFESEVDEPADVGGEPG
jgi:two-component system response regulator AdeR